MTDVCPDCGRPNACARNFHPVGADDCMALTLEKLEAERAVVNATVLLVGGLKRWPGGQSVAVNELDAVIAVTDALLALRAAGGETDV